MQSYSILYVFSCWFEVVFYEVSDFLYLLISTIKNMYNFILYVKFLTTIVLVKSLEFEYKVRYSLDCKLCLFPHDQSVVVNYVTVSLKDWTRLDHFRFQLETVRTRARHALSALSFYNI